MADEWGASLQEYLIDTEIPTCCAAGLAQVSDFQFYAAAPVAGDAGWGLIYKEDYEATITVEGPGGDAVEQTTTINEASTLKRVITEGKGPLWLGGEKYNVVKTGEEEIHDNTYYVVVAARPKKGVVAMSTGQQIVVGMFNEEQGDPPQCKAMCMKGVTDFAKYLKEDCGL